ncbi:hypothetical protein CBF23_014880, partial [Marinomonas agarivorans]
MLKKDFFMLRFFTISPSSSWHILFLARLFLINLLFTFVTPAQAKLTTTTTQGNWNGSSINVGGNASIDSDDNLTVKGSDVNVAGT